MSRVSSPTSWRFAGSLGQAVGDLAAWAPGHLGPGDKRAIADQGKARERNRNEQVLIFQKQISIMTQELETEKDLAFLWKAGAAPLRWMS